MRRGVERAAHVLRDAAPHRASSARATSPGAELAAERAGPRRARRSGSGGGAGPATRGSGARSAVRSGCRLRDRRRLGVGGCGAAAAAGAAGGCRGRRPRRRRCAAPDSMKARMSFFVTRPPAPVPGTVDGSTPCSAAIRATTGETKLVPFPARLGRGRGAGAGAAGAAAGSGRAAGAARARLGGDDAARLGGARRRQAARLGGRLGRGSAAADPAGAIVASTVPTSTVCPSATRIWRRRPRPGSAPRCRPCRSRSRAAARPARSARPAA